MMRFVLATTTTMTLGMRLQSHKHARALQALQAAAPKDVVVLARDSAVETPTETVLLTGNAADTTTGNQIVAGSQSEPADPVLTEAEVVINDIVHGTENICEDKFKVPQGQLFTVGQLGCKLGFVIDANAMTLLNKKIHNKTRTIDLNNVKDVTPVQVKDIKDTIRNSTFTSLVNSYIVNLLKGTTPSDPLLDPLLLKYDNATRQELERRIVFVGSNAANPTDTLDSVEQFARADTRLEMKIEKHVANFLAMEFTTNQADLESLKQYNTKFLDLFDREIQKQTSALDELIEKILNIIAGEEVVAGPQQEVNSEEPQVLEVVAVPQQGVNSEEVVDPTVDPTVVAETVPVIVNEKPDTLGTAPTKLVPVQKR